MSGSNKSRPFLYLTISAVDSGDDERLQKALAEIASRDPRISVNLQPVKNSLNIVEGESESHLDSFCDRLRDEYHLAINVGAPKPILLETIRESGEAEGKYIRQVGGSGNYGHCKLRIEPNKPGEGYSFISLVPGEVLPNEYVSSVDLGVRGAMQSGILHGHPLVDLKAVLLDGSYHDKDSNPKAFEIAGSTAFKQAARKASPVLLEPVMVVEIEVPEALTAIIEREINQHRGRIDRMLSKNDWSEIRAIVPLSELLNSASNGLADFPMEFAGYEALRDDGPSDENGSGVTANKPNYPRPRSRSEMARPAPDEEE
jgi:elongation factor G